jgi:hypothetical protein
MFGFVAAPSPDTQSIFPDWKFSAADTVIAIPRPGPRRDGEGLAGEAEKALIASVFGQ